MRRNAKDILRSSTFRVTLDILRFHVNSSRSGTERNRARVTNNVFSWFSRISRSTREAGAFLRVIRQLRKRNTYGISGNIIDSGRRQGFETLGRASSIRESSLIRTYVYVRGKRHVHEANCDGSKVQRASSALEKTKSTRHRLSARKRDNDCH